MFGSFFGFEGTIIKPMWLSPMHAMMKLPFVGQLNTVFIVAVAFGMALILLAMVFRSSMQRNVGIKKIYSSAQMELQDLYFMDSLS